MSKRVLSASVTDTIDPVWVATPSLGDAIPGGDQSAKLLAQHRRTIARADIEDSRNCPARTCRRRHWRLRRMPLPT